MIDRTPGQGLYAVTEREHRWLLRRLPEGVIEPVEILDKYLHGSTLRLRRVQAGSSVVYKLAQKVRHVPTQPSTNQLTNMYLSETEFGLLNQIEGAPLSKTRWHWTFGEHVLSVDEFRGPLRGLVMAEVELPLSTASPTAPPLTVADVTEDDRFSGGNLALLTRPKAQDLLRMIAAMKDIPTQG